MRVRKIQENDAAQFLDLLKQIECESKFMLLDPDERQDSESDIRDVIRSVIDQDNAMIFVCESDARLVGYLRAFGGNFNRVRHCVYIEVAVIESCTGRGIGTALFDALETWAGEHAIHRLDLTVMTHNDRAVGLYKKMGFEIEGTKRHSQLIDGHYVNHYYMSKLLD